MAALSNLCLLVLMFVAGSAGFNVQERLKAALEYFQSTESLKQIWEEHVRNYTQARERHQRKHKRSMFNCLDTYVPSPWAPASVHHLRPEDVSVVAAMGDSLTAGNGILASNIFQCLTEYRGRSWSIGGDLNVMQGVETMPNFLKEFNHNLKGYSVGHCSTDDETCSQLNVAIPGNVSSDMPMQARELIRRMKSRSDINYQDEWKVITFFIGGNDLCAYCKNPNLYRPAAYIQNIKEALDILHADVPKAFINLVEIFDIMPLAKVAQGFVCGLVTDWVCGCAKDEANNDAMHTASRDYQKLTHELVASGAYDTRDDFTVVLQPFFRNTVPAMKQGEYDLAYFSPDCFHFSDMGQNVAGKSLWNNMIEPVDRKQSMWHIEEPFHCPHTHGLHDGVFRTRLNSHWQILP